MTGQGALDLGFVRRRALGRADFVQTRANAEAATLIDRWRRWPEGRLALCGPEGAGKTHLVHVFAAEAGAAVVEAATLAAADAPALVARGAVAVEDGDRMGQGPETALFHLMNLAVAEGAALLLTGREPPARWPVALPDLRSRLHAMTPARLMPPDDALLAAVVAKALQDRALRYEPGLPAYVAARIERSFAAAEAAVAALDAASLAQRRPITRRLAAEVLG
jgi:chromosomal replication initiation ATPase DnaA